MKNTKIEYSFIDDLELTTTFEEIVEGAITEDGIAVIKSTLMNKELFLPERVGLLNIQFGQYSDNDAFCSLDSITLTDEEPTEPISVEELVNNFVSNCGKWKDSSASEYLRISVCGGYLKATVSSDPNYPGIDVEFIPEIENDEMLSNPRVLIEKPEGENLRAYVWDCPTQEDYTHQVDFGR